MSCLQSFACFPAASLPIAPTPCMLWPFACLYCMLEPVGRLNSLYAWNPCMLGPLECVHPLYVWILWTLWLIECICPLNAWNPWTLWLLRCLYTLYACSLWRIGPLWWLDLKEHHLSARPCCQTCAWPLVLVWGNVKVCKSAPVYVKGTWYFHYFLVVSIHISTNVAGFTRIYSILIRYLRN